MAFTRVVTHLPRKIVPSLFNCRISARYFSEQISSKHKELLKEDINYFLENHFYYLVATKAAGNTVTSSGEAIDEINDDEQIIPPLSESFTSSRSNWKFVLSKDNTKPYIRLKSRTVFKKGYRALQGYITGEIPAATVPAFTALERFYVSKEKHENSLKHLRSGDMSETKIASLLAQHFLVQLLPHPTNYILDSQDSKYKADDCPCGCGQPIHFGLTQLGSAELFQGQVDIVLFPSDVNLFMEVEDSTSALFTLKKADKESFSHDSVDAWQSNVEYGYDKISTTECNRNEFDTYQLCKQAISASFCKQKEMNNEYNNISCVPIVPVCAIGKDSYYVVMYDAEDDYLVKMYDNSLRIFHGDSIRFSAVLDLWLLIHHNLFCTKPNADILNGIRGTCNLIPQLGKERYASIVRNSNWLYQPERYPRTEIYPDESEFKDMDSADELYG